MKFNQDKLQRVANAAKAKTNNRRWQNAIDKAVAGLLGGWIVTELQHCVVITTESDKTYFANGHCQCEAFFRDQPCKHRAAARLIELYNETATQAVSSRAALIADIKTIWPRVEPHLPLETELLARFGKSNLEYLDDDMLRRVRLAIAM